jgi:hypothetical protein
VATALIGLDGVKRDLTEATALCAGSHGLNTTAGYIVRRTYFDGQAHADVHAFYGADGYSESLKTARSIREQQGRNGYAVIDTVYDCGCRGLG